MQFSLLVLIIDKINNLQNVQNYKYGKIQGLGYYVIFFNFITSHFYQRFGARI